MSEAGVKGARNHIESGELALYVIDALDRDRRDAVEGHVLVCDECAEGLAREARVEAALELVARAANARMAGERGLAPVISLVPSAQSAEIRARLVSGGRRSRWAGGVAGAFAAAAALVLAFSSTTAHSEPSGGAMTQRGPNLHDAAGDMSGAFGGEVASRDTLDGG